MTGWISELVQAMLDTVLDTLTTATLAVLDWVLGLLSATVFTSPDVMALPPWPRRTVRWSSWWSPSPVCW